MLNSNHNSISTGGAFMKIDSSDNVILYHGSTGIIEPKYGEGAKDNDYGVGFYCTENIEMAKEWSCKTGEVGFVNKYKVNVKGLSILNLKYKNTNDLLLWYYILIQNRTFNIQKGSLQERAIDFLKEKYSNINYEDYDIIEGFRADDSYFMYAQDFLQNSISTDKLALGMSVGKLGRQVVLKSKRSFDRIKFLGAEKSDYSYVKRYFSRDKRAREDYRSYVDRGNTFMIDILRKEGF